MFGYLLHIVLLVLMLGWYGRKLGKRDQGFYGIAILIKIAGAFCFGLFYVFVQKGGDTIVYFEAATHWHQLFIDDLSNYLHALLSEGDHVSSHFAGQPRAIFMVKVVSIYMIVAGADYWLLTLYFSLTAFISSWYFYLQLKRYQMQWETGWWMLLFVFPGLLFGGVDCLRKPLQ